jgi:thiamine biosynthesis lipoprotein
MQDDAMKNLQRSLDRRTFLKACGLLGVGAVAGGALQAAYRVVRLGPSQLSVERTLVRMGSFVTITAVHESRDRAEEAIGRAVEEMDRLAAILSRHDASAALAHLNREGELRDAPPELVDVVRESLWAHRVSGGAFDATVQPVLDLFEGAQGSRAPLPGDEAVRAALARVGSQRIELDERSVRFREPGVRVTLDGIAPGYIVDRMSEVLAGCGIENHLVNASGDIRVRGRRADGRPWHIAVEDPEKKGHYPEVIELASGAVSTSGNYEIYYDREKIHHHIIDPSTGVSPTLASSVSVIAETAVRSDALSTAVFVLPPARGLDLVDSLPATQCLVLGRRGESYRSGGWGTFAARGGDRSG